MNRKLTIEELKQAHKMYSEAYATIRNKESIKEISEFLVQENMHHGLCFFFKENFQINLYDAFVIIKIDTPNHIRLKHEFDGLRERLAIEDIKHSIYIRIRFLDAFSV